MPQSAGSISLKCVPVTGNDTASKRNPMKSGIRANAFKVERFFSLAPDSNISITDVRANFIEAINECIRFCEERTMPLLSIENTRLRVTNWAEEAMDMPLGEITTAQTPLLLSSIVSSGLVKSNSLLLLEEGKPPVPGMIELEVYLDIRDMGELLIC